jgi:hypothetical protein
LGKTTGVVGAYRVAVASIWISGTLGGAFATTNNRNGWWASARTAHRVGGASFVIFAADGCKTTPTGGVARVGGAAVAIITHPVDDDAGVVAALAHTALVAHFTRALAVDLAAAGNGCLSALAVDAGPVGTFAVVIRAIVDAEALVALADGRGGVAAAIHTRFGLAANIWTVLSYVAVATCADHRHEATAVVRGAHRALAGISRWAAGRHGRRGARACRRVDALMIGAHGGGAVIHSGAIAGAIAGETVVGAVTTQRTIIAPTWLSFSFAAVAFTLAFAFVAVVAFAFGTVVAFAFSTGVAFAFGAVVAFAFGAVVAFAFGAIVAFAFDGPRGQTQAGIALQGATIIIAGAGTPIQVIGGQIASQHNQEEGDRWTHDPS